jgi:aminopeptidase
LYKKIKIAVLKPTKVERRESMDSQHEAFAKTLVTYSVGVQPNEIVWVDVMDSTPIELVRAIMLEVQKAGGTTHVRTTNERLLRQQILGADERLLKYWAKCDLATMQGADKAIRFRDFGNIFHMCDVPTEQMKLFANVYRKPIIEEVVKRQNWVLTRFPTPAMAQLFNMSYEQLLDLYYKAVLFNYPKMAEAAEPLEELMLKTKDVRIVGPGTDISFSIQGIGVIPCVGKVNIPDGEVFTAPVRDSANGEITYNTRSISHEGWLFEGVHFVVKDGKIIEASCTVGDSSKLNHILDTDEGARYFGEFALGFHPLITETYGEVLFDEKVRGSLHFTPGASYGDASNGNQSAVHWDIVLDQTAEKGGGEIYFDGKLVRKDGLFIPDALQGLNPENLMAV